MYILLRYMFDPVYVYPLKWTRRFPFQVGV